MNRWIQRISRWTGVLGLLMVVTATIMMFQDREPLTYSVAPLVGPVSFDANGREEKQFRVTIHNASRLPATIIGVGPRL